MGEPSCPECGGKRVVVVNPGDPRPATVPCSNCAAASGVIKNPWWKVPPRCPTCRKVVLFKAPAVIVDAVLYHPDCVERTTDNG